MCIQPGVILESILFHKVPNRGTPFPTRLHVRPVKISTARTRRLIWVFARRTWNLVGNAVPRLIDMNSWNLPLSLRPKNRANCSGDFNCSFWHTFLWMSLIFVLESTCTVWKIKIDSIQEQRGGLMGNLSLSSLIFWRRLFHLWLWSEQLFQIGVSVKNYQKCKQCRSWWDGSSWAVSSGSTLFAIFCLFTWLKGLKTAKWEGFMCSSLRHN